MLDLISAIFSFLSVLQGIEKSRKSDQNLKSITEGMEQINVLLGVVMDAKECHDKFEKYNRRVIEDLRDFEKDNFTTKQIKNKMNTVLEVSRDLNHILEKSRKNLISKDEDKLAKLPIKVRDSIQTFYRVYPTYSNSIKNTKNVINNLRVLVKDKNFGEQFDRELILLREFSTETRSSADDVMYHSLPIIDFMHFELRDKIEGIL
jgi:hypothetical protein